MTKFKTIYAGEVDLSELPVEIERFNYATCTKCFLFQSDVTALACCSGQQNVDHVTLPRIYACALNYISLASFYCKLCDKLSNG